MIIKSNFMLFYWKDFSRLTWQQLTKNFVEKWIDISPNPQINQRMKNWNFFQAKSVKVTFMLIAFKLFPWVYFPAFLTRKLDLTAIIFQMHFNMILALERNFAKMTDFIEIAFFLKMTHKLKKYSSFFHAGSNCKNAFKWASW